MPNFATLVQALGAALCAILCALSSLGGGGMNRRRILASLGSHTPTAKDYVQDGLIAMWDGIENAGWGVHDPNANTWKDLTGGGLNFDVSSDGLSFGDDHLVMMNVPTTVSDARIETALKPRSPRTTRSTKRGST